MRRRIEMRTASRASKEAVRATALATDRSSPHRLERGDHVSRGRPFDDDGGVAPSLAMRLENARRPLAADANPAGDPYCFVYDQELAVVAGNEAEPSAKSGWIEDLDVDAGTRDLANEGARRPAGTNPVQQQANRDTTSGRVDERFAEAFSHFVRAEDVALERHRRLGAVD